MSAPTLAAARPLRPAERVAVVLSLLDAEQARGLAADWPPSQVDAVVAAYEAMGTLPRQAVLEVVTQADDLLRLQQHAGVNGIALFGPLPQDAEAQYEVRALLVENGSLVEDPVTGSANACLARYLAAQGQRQDYCARQGSAIQRAGRIVVRFAGETIWIGGQTLTLIDGTIEV